MKKRIFVLATVLMMFMGAVSASSINGDYKGNAIVKVYSKGKEIKTVVPAMIYEGNTVVPISVLRQLGATVKWEADTYSVDVKINDSHYDQKDINVLKAYSRIAEIYRRLGLLADDVIELKQYFALTYQAIDTNHKIEGNLKLYEESLKLSERSLQLSNDILEAVSKSNNLMLKEIEDVISLASSLNIDVTDMRQMNQQYEDALEQYKLSYALIEGFSRNESNTENYKDFISEGAEIVEASRKKSKDKYYEFYRKIQLY
jgi:hypothetical protein